MKIIRNNSTKNLKNLTLTGVQILSAWIALAALASAAWTLPELVDRDYQKSSGGVSLAGNNYSMEFATARNSVALVTRDDALAMVRELGRVYGKPNGLKGSAIRVYVVPRLGTEFVLNGGIVYIDEQASYAGLARGLARLWLPDASLKDEWAQVGFTDALALQALRHAGFGAAAQRLARTAEIEADALNPDRPLASADLRSAQFSQYVALRAKAFLFTQHLAGLVGDRDFDKMLSAISRTSKPLGLQDLILMVQGFSKQNAESLFRGWVTRGEYQLGSKRLAADSDRDGLSDVFEKIAGTHSKSSDIDQDGLSDGYEYWYAKDPRTANPNDHKVGLAPDGLLGDWTRRRIPAVYTDSVGDAQGLDLKEVFVARNNGRFCTALSFSIAVPDTVQWEVQGLIQDAQGLQVASFGAKKGDRTVWVEKSAVGAVAAKSWQEKAEFAAGDSIELCVQEDILVGNGPHRINVSVWDSALQTRMDHMGAWWAPIPLIEVK